MENWKNLANHNGYLVSSGGRIMRKDSGRIYTGRIDHHGYVRFDLSENGKRFCTFAHRAVAEAFIPKIKGKDFVNHLDGNKANNCISNLEWCTAKENSQHAFNVLGVKPANRIPVICIETQVQYESANYASRQTGICASNITQCCKGKRKTARGYHWKYCSQ